MSVTNISEAAYVPFEEIYSRGILNSPELLPTEDDLPCDDGEPMETERHKDQMNLLIESLKAYWKDSRRYYTGGNMFLFYDPSDTRKFKGPDFFLVMGAESRERKSWVVWQEGMRFPDIIIELLSDTTKKIDKGEKKKLYRRVFRTPEYYIYDPLSQEFEGYRLAGNRYRTVKPDKKNRLFSPTAGLYLAIKDNWLRWMTEGGYILPSYEELSKQHEQRAEQHKQCAELEKQRAELEKQRAEQEKQRAEQHKQCAELEKQRAELEKQRAEQEKQRADLLAEKLLAMGIDPKEITDL
ncbi:MAG: Uma2 family endonuclease [Desulfobacteraceae bacterium]|nr:Uma2 family endonuclease [Desulfobacteraceae bacterium]